MSAPEPNGRQGGQFGARSGLCAAPRFRRARYRRDDQVDAFGLLGQLLAQMVPGQSPRPPEKPKRDTGYRPLSLAEEPLDWMMF
jgi:hypothetical protein